MESYKREFIQFLEKAGVLKFGDFTAKSGRKIPYFINAGEIKTGKEIATLGEFYARAYREKLGQRKAVLYGPAYKGISIAVSAAVALSRDGLDVPFFFNRKEAKDHGEGGEDGNQAATDDALFSHGLFSCVMVVIMRRRSSPVNSLRKVIVMSSSL